MTLALPTAWQPDPDARPKIDGDVVRTIAGIRVHCINGTDYLSTSTVLALSPWGKIDFIPPAALAYGAERGRYVDQACRWWDESTLDMDSLTPQLAPYVQSWKHWVEHAMPRILTTEELVLNTRCATMGYVDRRVLLRDDTLPRTTIVDLKSGAHIGMRERLQLASYAFNGERRVIVQATKKGTPIVHEFTDMNDYKRFEQLAYESHEWIKEQQRRG